MAASDDILRSLQEIGVCAIIRHMNERYVAPFAETMRKSGLVHIEVTLNTDGAYDMLEQLSSVHGLVVGAGTVMDEPSARQAMRCGAKFLVSPHTSESVLRFGAQQGIPVIPGALTPTEIVHAAELGAKLIKVFPASTMGSRYIREIRGPLADLKLMATGGITVDNVAEFVQAGADAVGIGSSLASREELASGSWDSIESRTKLLLERFQAATAAGA